MTDGTRPFAIVTGASTGIGFDLAKCCADAGYDLLIAADDVEIHDAAVKLRRCGGRVQVLEGDLSTIEGVTQLLERVGTRPVEALLANAGRGLGRAFLDQDFNDVLRVIDTNVTGTLLLVQRVGRSMRAAKHGRILIAGAIAGSIPGPHQAIYNGTRALLDSFATALRAELQDSGVTVTCLMPGANGVTETQFAKLGFEAMLKGEAHMTAGFPSKLRATNTHAMPVLAEQPRTLAESGSAA